MLDMAVMTRQHVSPHSGAEGWDTEQCQIWQSWSGNMFHHTLVPKGGILQCQIWQSWSGNMFHHTLGPKGGILSNARFGSH